MHKSKVVVVALAFVLAAALPAGAQKRGRKKSVAAGMWGGAHIRLNVESKGASVEYDCGGGTIDEPLTLDAAGRFSARGTHLVERGGPVREDRQADKQQARYTGRVRNGMMTLTVRLVDGNQTVGTYTLGHRREAHLVRCL